MHKKKHSRVLLASCQHPWNFRKTACMHTNKLNGDTLCVQDLDILNAPAPRPDQLPMGASRNTWPNIVNNKVWHTPALYYIYIYIYIYICTDHMSYIPLPPSQPNTCIFLSRACLLVCILCAWCLSCMCLYACNYKFTYINMHVHAGCTYSHVHIEHFPIHVSTCICTLNSTY